MTFIQKLREQLFVVGTSLYPLPKILFSTNKETVLLAFLMHSFSTLPTQSSSVKLFCIKRKDQQSHLIQHSSLIILSL